MRRIGFALASLLLALPVLGGAVGDGALAATGDTLIVTGDGVNVRYGPSPDAKVRMQVYHDQPVSEIERQGDWVRVEIAGTDGASGWIHTSLLAAPSPAQLARAHQRANRRLGAGVPEAKPPAPASQPAPAKPQADQSPGPEPSAGAVPAAAADAASEPSAAAPSDRESASPEVSVAPPATGAAGSGQAAVAPAAGPADAAGAAELARFRDSVDYLNSRSTSVAGIHLFDTVEAVGDGVVRVGATDAWTSLPPGSQQSYANTLVDRWAAARGYSGPATVQIVGPDGKLLLESNKP
jgi:hypothetical protein